MRFSLELCYDVLPSVCPVVIVYFLAYDREIHFDQLQRDTCFTDVEIIAKYIDSTGLIVILLN